MPKHNPRRPYGSSRKKKSSWGSSGRFARTRQMRTSAPLGCLRAPFATNYLIGEALTLEALKGDVGTAHVVDAQPA